MQITYHWMNTRLHRALGAQFRKKLGEKILIFRYPYPATRLFHTIWCPPLRIVVVDSDAEGARVVFDRVVKPWRFVNLPAGMLVLEMDPGVEYAEALKTIRETSRGMARISEDLPVGGIDVSVCGYLLLRRLFAESYSDLRSVKQTCLNEKGVLDPRKLKERYSPWARGNILASAGFILDNRSDPRWSLPPGAFPLCVDLVRSEYQFADDLLAAMNGSMPGWKSSLKAICIGCGRTGSWRPVLDVPQAMPSEISWRLFRPENHIPLCKYCTARYKTAQNPRIRLELTRAFWGARFTALEYWFECEQGLNGGLPEDWDKGSHPLWPDTFGGDTWESGSGSMKHVTPEWPWNVERTPDQITYLKAVADWEVIITTRSEE
jgi:hypothetical protein